MPRQRTPLGALTRGLAAGAAGTAAMTAWQLGAAKLQGSDSGGSEEEGGGRPSWDDASPPAEVGRRLIEGLFRTDVPPERVGALTNAMHWVYGLSWGCVYGMVSASRRRGPVSGALFGLGVWASSYAQLVPMGLYAPPWTYPPKDLALEGSYHLAYGLGTAAGWRVVR